MLRIQRLREYWYISGTTIQFISSLTVHGILAEKSSWVGPGKQTAKTWFGLEKKDENLLNYP